MPSPFPGMDPYLERFWRDVHAGLIIYARDQLQDELPGDLRARAETTGDATLEDLYLRLVGAPPRRTETLSWL